MSDNFITICPEKEVENPKELGLKIIKWLQEKDIIEHELSDCILSSKSNGYKPGNNYLEAIGLDENILQYKVCGLELKTEREVFNAGAFTAMTKLECPSCNTNRFEGITPQDFFTDNCTKEQLQRFHSVFPEFDNWTNYKTAVLTCPHCSAENNLMDYKTDYSIVFSNIGFTFWNWPDFKEEFLNKFKAELGVAIVQINGHL